MDTRNDQQHHIPDHKSLWTQMDELVLCFILCSLFAFSAILLTRGTESIDGTQYHHQIATTTISAEIQ